MKKVEKLTIVQISLYVKILTSCLSRWLNSFSQICELTWTALQTSTSYVVAPDLNREQLLSFRNVLNKYKEHKTEILKMLIDIIKHEQLAFLIAFIKGLKAIFSDRLWFDLSVIKNENFSSKNEQEIQNLIVLLIEKILIDKANCPTCWKIASS
ncbi:hypothetical protein M0813_09239 [Anaeramoeba flamelloides]|uniref:Uncharacterized protein n=1 Tax=Anaeramoeba flamelloides TaxID=1746091 RepID=A0ABQ8X6E8_9EUKA|nr:hypothetical protein M0813_09239 [Anaeramoeba flamelloides]